MENVPAFLAAFPELAPGIFLGTVFGVGYGLYEDWKASDGGLPHRWWQAGGIGAGVGGCLWFWFTGS